MEGPIDGATLSTFTLLTFAFGFNGSPNSSWLDKLLCSWKKQPPSFLVIAMIKKSDEVTSVNYSIPVLLGFSLNVCSWQILFISHCTCITWLISCNKTTRSTRCSSKFEYIGRCRRVKTGEYKKFITLLRSCTWWKCSSTLETYDWFIIRAFRLNEFESVVSVIPFPK